MQEEADRLLDRALAETGVPDPREPYRALLRELKERKGEEYEAAVKEYRESVLRGIAEEGADPLERWLSYGCGLAQRLYAGRTVVLDGTGRALPYAPPPSWKEMILHLPDDRKARAVLVSSPPEPTPAQTAAVELLVHGRLRIAAGGDDE